MKDWLMEHYPEDDLSYERLRQAVQEAWEAVGADYLEEMILTMPERCKAVVLADGRYTGW